MISDRPPERAPVPTAEAPRENILVVDDDAKNLLAIEAAIGDLGPHLVMVRSGAEALRELLQREFALILLDVHMPEMDGFETAKLIRNRKRNRHVPIIFVTAYDQSDARVLEGYTLGAVDFLFKPIVPEMLHAKAAVFCELSRRTAEVARQAEEIRRHERQGALQRLEQERQKWEQDSLRRQMEHQRKVAEELASKADELARTIAQREAAQRELTRINAQLAQSDRRKDEFLATLAHELRNPLAPMAYALGLLEDVEDVKLRDVFDRMNRQLAHLHRLVDDLLDVSRVTSGKIELRQEVIDVREAVEQAVDLCRSSMEDQEHRLHLDVTEEPLTVNGDAVRLAQIVSNLLNNAARYTDQGGNVWVRVRRARDHALITVRDDGKGITPGMLETIFDPFVQENAGGGGLGLGLHLVKRLVDLHDGRVGAFSDGPGKGSCFEIRVPLVHGIVRAAFPTPAGGIKSPPAGPLSVVVIEDQEDIREMALLLLERWGHDCLCAEDGQSGISMVVDRRPDVVMVDIGLPDIDGYEVAAQLRERLGDGCPPLVAVTGWGQDRDRERALAAGFARHLVKPVSPRELRHVLAELATNDVPRAARALKATLDEFQSRACSGEVNADRQPEQDEDEDEEQGRPRRRRQGNGRAR